MSKILLRTLLLLSCAAAPAMAIAAPIYPGASGVGLEPPPGMKPATSFNGFQDGPASIVITEMPKEAYPQIDSQRAMFTQRFGATKADDVGVNGIRGFIVKGEQPARGVTFRKWVLVLDGPQETALVSVQVPSNDKALSDAVVETALRSVVFRKRPGLAEQVAALPFAVGDMAGFEASGTSLGAALILVDGKPADAAQRRAHVIVLSSGSTPPKDNRVDYAKAQLQAFQAIRTTEIVSAKPIEAGGAEWVEVKAKGSEGQAENPIAISYYLRFDAAGTVSVLCIAPQEGADRFDDRFKTVALSVKPKKG